MPREDDKEDDAEEDDDATGQCSESVDNGMMFCEEVLMLGVQGSDKNSSLILLNIGGKEYMTKV